MNKLYFCIMRDGTLLPLGTAWKAIVLAKTEEKARHILYTTFNIPEWLSEINSLVSELNTLGLKFKNERILYIEIFKQKENSNEENV